MTQPNTAFKAVRTSLLMSQDDLARAVRAAGDRAGEPNDCSKRLVQRWEAGLVKTPRGIYARALEMVTGQPIENLGFEAADERYGIDRREVLGMAGEAAAIAIGEATQETAPGPLTSPSPAPALAHAVPGSLDTDRTERRRDPLHTRLGLHNCAAAGLTVADGYLGRAGPGEGQPARGSSKAWQARHGVHPVASASPWVIVSTSSSSTERIRTQSLR